MVPVAHVVASDATGTETLSLIPKSITVVALSISQLSLSSSQEEKVLSTPFHYFPYPSDIPYLKYNRSNKREKANVVFSQLSPCLSSQEIRTIPI